MKGDAMRTNTKMNIRQTFRAVICRATIEAAVGALCFGGIGAFFSGLSVLSRQLQLSEMAAIITAMCLVGAAVCSFCCVLRMTIEQTIDESSHKDDVRRFMADHLHVTVIGQAVPAAVRLKTIVGRECRVSKPRARRAVHGP
jgi:hypothetical protein